METITPSGTALSRKERERLARRQLMLNAARAVFAEKGYEQARLEEIAERAEFGKGTLYNYFEGGKQEILLAIIEELFSSLNNTIRRYVEAEAAAHRPVREVFRGLIASIVGYFREHQEMFPILMKEAQRMLFDAQPETVERLRQMQEEVISSIVVAVEAAAVSGAIRALPPRFVAHSLMGHVKGYLLYACTCSPGTPAIPATSPDAAVDLITTILLDGLVLEPGTPFSLPIP